jgi:hypothetical protein
MRATKLQNIFGKTQKKLMLSHQLFNLKQYSYEKIYYSETTSKGTSTDTSR